VKSNKMMEQRIFLVAGFMSFIIFENNGFQQVLYLIKGSIS
jgi:hypothetical protein